MNQVVADVRAFRRVAAAVVVALAVAASGCSLFDDRPPVAIIGDSITWQAASPIASTVGRDFSVDVRAVPGATIADMTDRASRMGRRDPEQLVVNLGTNDVVRNVSPNQSAADLAVLLDQFPTVKCIHVVTVHNRIFNLIDGDFYTERSQATNAALQAVAEQRGASIINWDAALGMAAASGTPDLLSDTVHLTDDGIDLLVNLYNDALQRGCPALDADQLVADPLAPG